MTKLNIWIGNYEEWKKSEEGLNYILYRTGNIIPIEIQQLFPIKIVFHFNIGYLMNTGKLWINIKHFLIILEKK